MPPKLRASVLELLHEGHMGSRKMKGLARGAVWWPQIDKAIEETARNCVGCQETARRAAAPPLHRWEFPVRPWQRVHVDFSGPFGGKMYLLVVDAHTKWPEIVVMTSTTADATTDKLRSIIARFGIPEQSISDKGPQFTSEVFRQFIKINGIHHATGAPYHPATNGIAPKGLCKVSKAHEGRQIGQDATAQARQIPFCLSLRATRYHRTEPSRANVWQKPPYKIGTN